jgi:aminotransferase
MISVFGSLIDENEIDKVRSVMESQWLGFGKKVDEFEASFASYRGIPEMAMVDSGSNALFMAVKLLNLPQGSEVIVPSFTWVSCAQAVLMAGCVPVFCDVDLQTMNVRAIDIEPRITTKTAAIMVVHYAGLPVEMDSILALGLPVIEDAAHAVVSSYKGRPCGTIGDVGIFSFDAVKNLAVGEGGGLIARDPASMERARRLRYCGIGKSGFESAVSSAEGKKRWWEYHIDEPFIKMLPTNIAGAIGLGQLEKLDALQARRREIWQRYDHELGLLPGVDLPVGDSPHTEHSYFTYCIQAEDRDELAFYLFDRGIYTTVRYHPLHLNPLYGQMDVNLPNSQTLNARALNIPLHPRLTDDEVSHIVSSIATFQQGRA